MEHRFHLVRISANRKLGGIPASTTSRSSCPDNCSYKGSGCYGDGGPISMHWKAVSEGPSRLRKYPTAKSTPQWRDALSA